MIVFIGCGATKMKNACKARKMYVGNYVQFCLAYAQTFTTQDNIYILSAKYGVLPLEKVIEPYNKTLNNMNIEEKQDWKNMVIKQLEDIGINKDTEVVFICGTNYYTLLEDYFTNYKLPLPKQGIGVQQHFMIEELREYNKTHSPKILMNNLLK
jgi:cytoplasmic iron level regulating protein YaaA (DUF328/UPF0246 family)